MFGTTDLKRGLFGHLFNGYDQRHVRTDLKQVRASADAPALAEGAA